MYFRSHKIFKNISSGCVLVLVDVVMIITSDSDKDIGRLRGPGGATCDMVTLRGRTQAEDRG